ncbi:MAG: hypothetical protein Q7K26_01425 [bacterium]|nr:hypothetical protein [bacterium]
MSLTQKSKIQRSVDRARQNHLSAGGPLTLVRSGKRNMASSVDVVKSLSTPALNWKSFK